MAKNVDTSILVKPPVIAAWLILCIITVLFGKTTLAILLGFVFLLTLCSYLWARSALKEIDFVLDVSRSGIFPGQSFVVTRSVRNHKALPMLWTEIRESCSLTDPAAPIADVIVAEEGYEDPEVGTILIHERLYTLAFVKWYGAVSFKDEWRANRRGIVEISASMLRSGDGFGLCAEERLFTFGTPRRIVVYPPLVQTSIQDILNDMWDTRSETDGFLKDRTIIKSVRDYLPGDSARDVNMRLFARGQAMQTNVFETVTPDKVLFVLDAGSFRGGAAEVFEHVLSVAASLINDLASRGIKTALMMPASQWFPEICTEPSSAERDIYRMFELLAAASQEDADFTAEIPISPDEPGRIYVLCSDTDRLTFPPGFLFPEYKTLFLTSEASAVSDGERRVRNLFDFERAAS